MPKTRTPTRKLSLSRVAVEVFAVFAFASASASASARSRLPLLVLPILLVRDLGLPFCRGLPPLLPLSLLVLSFCGLDPSRDQGDVPGDGRRGARQRAGERGRGRRRVRRGWRSSSSPRIRRGVVAGRLRLRGGESGRHFDEKGRYYIEGPRSFVGDWLAFRGRRERSALLPGADLELGVLSAREVGTF